MHSKALPANKSCAPRSAILHPSISCVIPAYHEEEGIAEFLMQLCEQISTLTDTYEVIVVDDGSKDSTALEVIASSGGLPVKLISLSRNFGKESAISAGLDHVSGDVTIVMDADFQHPFHIIPEFLRWWQQGYDMVYGIRRDRDTDPAWRRLLSRSFYRILSRGASIDIPADAGDFRLFDRRVVLALQQLPERSRFMKGLYNWVGFPSVGIPFDVEARRTGKSHFHFARLFELAMTGLTSFSVFPLRLLMAGGLFLSGCSILYGLSIILHTLLYGNDVPGWATLAVATTLLGGVQLLSLGIVGEYVARIFNEVKKRPNYLIAEKHGFSSKDNPS